MSQWISVDERLPETPDNVLAVLNGQVCIMSYFLFTENGETNKVWAYVYDGINGDGVFDDNYYPTHWMPIPQPPTIKLTTQTQNELDRRLVDILEALRYHEWNYRLESESDIGVYATLIDRSTYPRLWIDNSTAGEMTIMCETPESTLNRLSPLPEKDWIERFFGKDTFDAVHKMCDYIICQYPKSRFAEWWSKNITQ